MSGVEVHEYFLSPVRLKGNLLLEVLAKSFFSIAISIEEDAFFRLHVAQYTPEIPTRVSERTY